MTKNEAANIGACLTSCSRCQKVFVVDSESIDDTCKIAYQHGADVVQFQWNGRYPKKKQWCLENLVFPSQYMLFLDADERLDSHILNEIADLVSTPSSHSGYYIYYDYVFLGRRLRFGHKIRKLALMKVKSAHFLDNGESDVMNMWEVEGHIQPHVEGTIGKLHNTILHHDCKDLFSFFDRHNRYSDAEADVQMRGGLTGETTHGLHGLLKRIFYQMPSRSLVMFIYCYIIKFGFLDGSAGFHFAMTRLFYYWQINVKTYERRLVLGKMREGTYPSQPARNVEQVSGQ